MIFIVFENRYVCVWFISLLRSDSLEKDTRNNFIAVISIIFVSFN